LFLLFYYYFVEDKKKLEIDEINGMEEGMENCFNAKTISPQKNPI
jgi:hypothetical protein